jgi:hypothetical protein
MADTDFASISINLQDIERIARKLDLLPAFVAGVQAGGVHVKSVIDVYPPSTDANSPGPYPKRWYERGYGPKWALKAGGVHGRKSSETLGRRWTIVAYNDGLSCKVGNNATYARFVHDLDRQPFFHAARGWKVIQDVARDEADNVRDLVSSSIRAEIKRRGLNP